MDYHERMPAPPRAGKRRCLTATGLGARRFLVLIVAGVASSSGAGVHAQTAHAAEHLHTPLEISAQLTWSELIRVTFEHYPQFVELAARDREASALMGRAGSWLKGQPAISMRYQTDRPWDNVNLREYEFGLELPLWRIGERRAAESLGAAATEESGAAALALRHEIIGLLRLTVWDMEKAANELGVARDGARVAADLQSVIERRYEAGELPLSETLLVRSTAMEREAAVIAAEALLVDAERAYQSLTGLNVKSAQIAEPLTMREEFDSTHPQLMLADAQLQRARADLELTERAAKGTPTLTIGPRREKAAFSDYSADSLGVSVSMPFGGRAHATAATAAAVRLVARAESSRLQLLRELDLELHEARHSLLVIEQALALAQQRAELAARSFAMSQQGFAQGEMTLLELLRSEETALLTQREVVGLEVERQRAIAQINHAIGVWP